MVDKGTHTFIFRSVRAAFRKTLAATDSLALTRL